MSETQTTPELAADVLATAVEKAMRLERERSEREIDLAVKAAKREAVVDHRLDGHEQRLNAVNGSISRTGTAMTKLTESVNDFHEEQRKRNTEADTREQVHWKQKGEAYSKKQVYVATAAIGTMLAVPFVTEIIKLVFGGVG